MPVALGRTARAEEHELHGKAAVFGVAVRVACELIDELASERGSRCGEDGNLNVRIALRSIWSGSS